MNTSTRDTVRIGAEEAVVLLGTRETEGVVFALEVEMPPGGGPPVPHRHAPAELYRVESGELTLYTENDEGSLDRRTATAGELVHIAGSQLHTIRNESDVPAHAVAFFIPGAEMEAFFREVGQLDAPDQSDPATVMRVAASHGITFEGARDDV
jgi:hypothetical protein